MTTPTTEPTSTAPPTTEQQPIGCCELTGDPDIDGTTTTTVDPLTVELPNTGAGAELTAGVAGVLLALGVLLARAARRLS